MIGNDIVDLSFAYSATRSLERRYLDKVFSKDEQDYIHKSINPKESLWWLWSMKESAYKIYIRNHKKAFYAPAKFHCKIIDEKKGTVTCNGMSYYTFSEEANSCIHTIALTNLADSFHFDLIKLLEPTYVNQHRSGYAKLIALYSANTGVNTADLVIRKDRFGIPELFNQEKKTNLVFSVSHHGHYAAVAMLTG